MANPRMKVLRDEFIANRDGCAYLDKLAADENRDLTDDERTAYTGALDRMEKISAEFDDVHNRQERFDAAAVVTASLEPATKDRTPAHTTPRSPVTYDPARAGQTFRPSVSVEEMGKFALDVGRAKLGRVTGKVPAEEADEVLNRYNVDPSNELGRVVAHGVSADGTAPVTIEGDLIKFVDANRYAVNAARRLPMPDNRAPTFKRPRATQLTTVAQQVNEGDVLSSQRLQITGDTVTKTTRGGVLALSEQEIDWTDPAMLGLAIQDLASSYAVATDVVLTAAIVAAASDVTETVLAAALPTSANFVTAIASAAAVVYAASKRLPDTLFIDVNWWSRLIQIVDLNGRPLFPFAGPMNTFGTGGGVTQFTGFNVLGLQVVVDPNFAADTMIVAASELVEFYEQNKGLLTINVPSTLEVQYAYRGYVAANVYAQGLGLIEAV